MSGILCRVQTLSLKSQSKKHFCFFIIILKIVSHSPKKVKQNYLMETYFNI